MSIETPKKWSLPSEEDKNTTINRGGVEVQLSLVSQDRASNGIRNSYLGFGPDMERGELEAILFAGDEAAHLALLLSEANNRAQAAYRAAVSVHTDGPNSGLCKAEVANMTIGQYVKYYLENPSTRGVLTPDEKLAKLVKERGKLMADLHKVLSECNGDKKSPTFVEAATKAKPIKVALDKEISELEAAIGDDLLADL